MIDADSLKEGIKELKQSPWYNNDINPSWKQGIKDAVHVVETLCIDEEPTVDAVPVVRCKDCANCRKSTLAGRSWKHCAFIGNVVYDDNYCCWAERKEE